MKLDQINKDIPKILKELKKIAVVGISDKSLRDSYMVANFMMNKGYQVFPVNPNYEKVLGKKCYPSLLQIEEKVELVDIFRKSEYVIPVVKEAIHIGAKAVWLQLGVINEDAVKLALDAGLMVVMNHCWKQEYQYLMNE
jgi:predicted CoA-binding protein